jgi:hypothetical protein
MTGIPRRKRSWWQQDANGHWYEWNGKTWEKRDGVKFPPPTRRQLPHITVSEPLVVYAIGLLAALLALIIALAWVPHSAAAVLAPVIGVIGAFAGHAAGHASAVDAIKATGHTGASGPPRSDESQNKQL